MNQWIKYDNHKGEGANWVVTEQEFMTDNLGKFESIFTQGNGYFCVRNSVEEDYVGQIRNMFVAGSYNKPEEGDVSELPNMPDFVGMKITVNGKAINLEVGTIVNYERTLNLKNGIVTRMFDFKNQDDILIHFESERFVSQVQENIMASKIKVSCDQDVTIKITSGIEGNITNSGTQHLENLVQRIYGDSLQLVANTTQSKVEVILHSHTKLSKMHHILKSSNRRAVFQIFEVDMKKNETLEIEKISMIHTSRDLKYRTREMDLEKDKLILLKEFGRVIEEGYAELANESMKWWKDFWDKNDVKIDSESGFEQLAIRFAIYHLNAMVNKHDDRFGVGAKGLSGEGYKGHSFWDTELFILPYFTLTQPEIAKNLLRYRYYNLEEAKKKAKKAGFLGASFPWEACWYEDGDETPANVGVDIVTGELMEILMGTIEVHITADIAYATWQYYCATRDEEFMKEYGNELIIETALFWTSRFQFIKEKDRYEMIDVIGPDEYTDHVDNNAYTNYMAVHNMKCALKIIDKLMEKNITQLKALDLLEIKKRCEDVISRAYLPQPGENGIVEQFTGFEDKIDIDISQYKEIEEAMSIYKDYSLNQLSDLKLAKQADLVMLLYLFEDIFEEEVRKKNFLYYENHTLHDSSLSKCIHAIVANDLRFDEMAKEFYKGSLKIDLGENMKSSNDGIHSASMGGIFLATIRGFCGIKILEEGLAIQPNIPRDWNAVSFHLNWQGALLEVVCEEKICKVINKSEKNVTLKIKNEDVVIEAGGEVQR